MKNKVSTKKLTSKQEKFAQAIVDGHTQSEAYKLAYSTANQSPEGISSNAYKLAKHTAVVLRIQELTRDIGLAVVEARAWDRVRLIDEAEANLQGAREDRAWAPANRAVEIIARLTGNLEDPVSDTNVRITKITVVLPAGEGPDDGDLGVVGRVVDAEGYEVMDEPEVLTP